MVGILVSFWDGLFSGANGCKHAVPMETHGDGGVRWREVFGNINGFMTVMAHAYP